jgi:hypothetical protein
MKHKLEIIFKLYIISKFIFKNYCGKKDRSSDYVDLRFSRLSDNQLVGGPELLDI